MVFCIELLERYVIFVLKTKRYQQKDIGHQVENNSEDWHLQVIEAEKSD